jgi:mRNA-degrading endonuclease toxin of MazEF toxin-antitoxin module
VKPFDIVSWQAPGWNEPHPAVIVSHPKRAANKDRVEVLACTSQRATRPPEETEVILDEADGLDWQTLCKCDLIYAPHRSELKAVRGRVTEARQEAIVRTMIAAHDWAAVL